MKELFSIKIVINILLFFLGIINILFFLYQIDNIKNNLNSLLIKREEILKGETISYYQNKLLEMNEFSDECNKDIKKCKEDLTNDVNFMTTDIENIELETESLSAKLENLKLKNSQLNTEYEKLTNHKIDNVVTISQYPNYPNGCEAVALTILLKYYGINISVDEVISKMPTGLIPYSLNGVNYGSNPNYVFLGSPYSTTGWGIWDKGLANTANKIKPGIINGTGMDFSDVLKIVSQNRPVIVWTSINLNPCYVYTSWYDIETGESIVWKNSNHTVVVIGYTDSQVIISDPINGQIRYFDKVIFEDIYNCMGKKAIYY